MNRWTLIWAAVKAFWPALKDRITWSSTEGDIAFGINLGYSRDYGYVLAIPLGYGVLAITSRKQA